MTTPHLSDDDIQQYALDPSRCSRQECDHIESCEICSEAMIAYKSVITQINTASRPSFDFDVYAVVAERLPQRSSGLSWTIISVVTLVMIVTAFVFIRGQQYLLGILPSVPIILLQLIGVAVFTAMIFQLIETFHDYRRKMKALKF
jgi:hypothetical protein